MCSDYPSAVGQIQLVDGWSNAGSATAAPDFYHYAGSFGGDIPVTPVGQVNSFEGNGIAGFIATGQNHSDFRTYLQNELSEALEVGQKYRVTLRMCNGIWTAGSQAGLKTSDIGLHFSVAPPVQVDYHPIMATPQVKLDSTFFSRDWAKIYFTFEATDAFEFMTLGVFGDDGGKTIEVVEGDSPQFAYYFVDQVEIMPIGLPEQTFTGDDDPRRNGDANQHGGNPDLGEPASVYIPNAFTPNEDGENDLFLPVIPTVVSYHLQIFNRWGEQVFESVNPQNGWDGTARKGRKAEAGTYIWQMSYQRPDSDSLEKTSGTLTLIR